MLAITPKADLGVMYEADIARYRADGRLDMTDRVTKEAFMRFFAGCPSIGFQRDGRDIGGVIYDGEHAHIAVLPQYHGHWGMLLKPALQWLFSQSPEVLVEVERDNKACLRFIRHAGWECVSETADEFTFLMKPQPVTRRTAHALAQRRTPAAGASLATTA